MPAKSFRPVNQVTTAISEERGHGGDEASGSRPTNGSGCWIARTVFMSVTSHDKRAKVGNYDAVRILTFDVRWWGALQ